MPAKTPTELYQDSVDELYDFNGRFFNDMSKMKKILTPEIRASLSSQDLTDLEILLMPLQKFQNFLVRSSANLSDKDSIQEILTQFESEAFEKNKNAYQEVRRTQVAFNAFLGRLREKGVNPNVVKLLNDNFIKPVQTFNKYELHMKVMRKAYAEAQDIPLTALEEFMASRDDKTLMHKLAFLNKYPKSDVSGLLKLEQIFNLNNALQKQTNTMADFDIFGLSTSERNKMHKELTKLSKAATLESMTAQLAQLAKMFDLGQNMANAPSTDEKLKTIMMTFCDAYIDERSQGLLGTKRSPFLESILDRIIKEFKIDVSGGKKRDEAVFEYAGKAPLVSAALVAHLYARAVTEGMNGVKDQTVFTNAVKAVVRMGNDAIKAWNQLAVKYTQQEGNDLILPLNTVAKDGKVSRFKEKNIGELYASKLEKMPKEVISRYHPSLLVDWVVQATQPGDMAIEQYKKFQTIIDDLKRAGRSKDPAEIHKVFMLAYFDTYITERTKSGLHSQPGKLQSFLESLVTDGGKHSDTALFDTVPKHSAEAMNLAMKAVALAVTDIQNQTQFVNILKAVKRMGIESEWNGLVAVDYKGLVLTDKTDLSEKGIEKLWRAVKDNLNVPASPSRNAQPSVSTSLDKFGLMGKGADHSPTPTRDSPEPRGPSPTPKKE